MMTEHNNARQFDNWTVERVGKDCEHKTISEAIIATLTEAREEGRF